MYNQTGNALLLTSPLPSVTETGELDFYNLGCPPSVYYKDVDYGKMQRRDSGAFVDPAVSQNIFHDFITEQEHCLDHEERNEEEYERREVVVAAGASGPLESATFFDALAMASPSSSCEEYETFVPTYESPMGSYGPMPVYQSFGTLNDGSEGNVEVCNPASISPLPPSPVSPYSEECFMKSGYPYDYQFAMHQGPLSPISPPIFPVESDSDCSLPPSSNPSSPEPLSPLAGPMSPLTDGHLDGLDSPSKPLRSRGRRVSNRPDVSGGKLFTCKAPSCGKVFKRSEHLKRHHRSIHTSDKPFPCPIATCSKRFSRSDNLNQHIRIHRHGKDSMKSSGRHFNNFTPFYAAAAAAAAAAK